MPFHAMLNGIGIGIGIGIGVSVSVGIGIVIGTESSIAHCGPMLKILWRSIKIWLRFGQGLHNNMKHDLEQWHGLGEVGQGCTRVNALRGREREGVQEQDYNTCLALPW